MAFPDEVGDEEEEEEVDVMALAAMMHDSDDELLGQEEVRDVMTPFPDSNNTDSDSESFGRSPLVPKGLSDPPLNFHGYKRGRELGVGVSGKVYMCSHRSAPANTGGGFAVKAVDLRRLRLTPNAEREQQKLVREVEILHKLPPHPHIVQLIDAFDEGDWLLLVLELVGGGDMYSVLMIRNPPRLQEREAAFVCRQLADGLQFLHGEGVIHRDLKLENVLIASQQKARPFVLYTVKITDFGLSKSVGMGFSEARSSVGTKPYTAPEVLAQSAYDLSSDLWGLGVLTFIMLVGHFPFENMAKTQAQVDGVTAKVETITRSAAARELVSGFLKLDPGERLSLDAALAHDWLQATADRRTPPLARKRQRVGSASDASASAASGMAVAAVPSSSPEALDASLSAAELLDGFEDPFAPFVEDQIPIPADELHTMSPKLGPASKLVATADDEHDELTDLVLGAAVLADGKRVAPAVTKQFVPPTTAQSCNADGAASEAFLKPSEVRPVSEQPDVMQVHVLVPGRLAESVLGRHRAQMKQLAATLGCQVWASADEDVSDDHRLIIIGNYSQCTIIQELIQSRLMDAFRAESAGETPPDAAEAVLLVRNEAAGVVLGKQGFVLKQIRTQTGAGIRLLTEVVRGQRPCIITGPLQSVLQAERHVFDLVCAVPVAQTTEGAKKWASTWKEGPNLPRARLSSERTVGDVISSKGRVGWIQPRVPIDHPTAAHHQGHIYVHEKDVLVPPLQKGQCVSFWVYADESGLGAEEVSMAEDFECVEDSTALSPG